MTPAPLALGLDVGTSGVRAAALTPDGLLAGLGSAAMADGDAARRDPAVWLAATAAALDELGQQVDLGQVGALSVDATSGTVLAVDTGGRPLAPALMYNDRVDEPAVAEQIAAAAPRDSAAHGPASGLARALALQETPRIGRLLHQADWIAGQFSGRFEVSDESNALKTGYDPVARAWPAWLDATPLRRALLPEVVPAGAATGRITPEAAQRFGLPEGAAVVAGVTDGCASFLATGARAPGDGVTALGTTLTIKLLSERPIFAQDYGIYSHRIGELWLAGGASNSGGGALAAQFDGEAIARLSARVDPDQDSGLDYYPLPRPGERFPIANPTLAPRLTPRPADDAAFLHGLLEGIARIEALGYRRLAELGAPPLARLRTVGGGAGNAVWTRLRARILGAPLAEPASDAAAAGVARLALPHATAQERHA